MSCWSSRLHPERRKHPNINRILRSSGLVSWLAAYFMTSPPRHAMPGQSKASSPWWKRCCHWWRRAYRARGAKHQWRMHVDIKCSRLHVWSRCAEDDSGQNSIQAGPPVSCVPHFKAGTEWKSATTRTWGSKGTVVGYLHTGQFACCLAFCLWKQRWGWRVLIEWDYRSDRG